MKPGPATSTFATPSVAASASAISAASSRGLAPTGFAIFIAMLEAQSPWSRLRGRSSGTSSMVTVCVEPRRSSTAVVTASRAEERSAGFTVFKLIAACALWVPPGT